MKNTHIWKPLARKGENETAASSSKLIETFHQNWAKRISLFSNFSRYFFKTITMIGKSFCWAHFFPLHYSILIKQKQWFWAFKEEEEEKKEECTCSFIFPLQQLAQNCHVFLPITTVQRGCSRSAEEQMTLKHQKAATIVITLLYFTGNTSQRGGQ